MCHVQKYFLLLVLNVPLILCYETRRTKIPNLLFLSHSLLYKHVPCPLCLLSKVNNPRLFLKDSQNNLYPFNPAWQWDQAGGGTVREVRELHRQGGARSELWIVHQWPHLFLMWHQLATHSAKKPREWIQGKDAHSGLWVFLNNFLPSLLRGKWLMKTEMGLVMHNPSNVFKVFRRHLLPLGSMCQTSISRTDTAAECFPFSYSVKLTHSIDFEIESSIDLQINAKLSK